MKRQNYKKQTNSQKLIFFWFVEFLNETCGLYYLEDSNNVFYCIPCHVHPKFIYQCDLDYLNKYRIGSEFALSLSSPY